MAFSAKQFSLFLLLTLFSSLQIHARDSQFFNKIPSTQNDVAVPTNKEALNNNQQQEQSPTFLPQKENAYGLYGHESGQNPPTGISPTTTPATPAEFNQPENKYRPKNYNPVAYVTQPEDNIDDNTEFSDKSSFSTNAENDNNYYNGGAQNYYNNNNQEATEFRSYPTDKNNNNANYYLNGGSSFNSEPTRFNGGATQNDDAFQPEGRSDTRFNGGATQNEDAFQPQGMRDTRFNSEPTRYNGGATQNDGAFQPQGMSDTRFLENGKYFYDVEAEKFASRPFEGQKGVRSSNEYYNRNFNANNNRENSVGVGGYQNQNQDKFLDEESWH